VDLSPAMVELARKRAVYDALVVAELTAYLREHLASFDVIVSADTLVYFGALEEVIAAAAGALRAGGLFVFTLEHGTGESGPGYRLETHGRYTHTRPYVERLLASSGLEPVIERAELRLETGVPVVGLVIRARKASADGR